jgi:lactoylglutathione lyase
LELVKQHLDIGLYTNNRGEMLEFWQQDVGLEFDHIGKLGGGVHQLRHFLGGDEAAGPMGPILKINHARDALDEHGPSGFRELFIAREGVSEARSMMDPDGNRLRLVPPGALGMTTTGVRVSVRDVASSSDFYGRVLQLPRIIEAGPNAYRCGETVLILEADPDADPNATKKAKGFRYITVQIRKADLEYETIVSRGGAGGMEPMTLGSTVRYAFVRDPDGNWIELSQRATITGSLEA